MGYILPINHYQYRDYQQRTNRTKHTSPMLEKVFKATLDNKLRQQEKQHREEDRKDLQAVREHLYTPEHVHMGRYPVQQGDQAKERIYAEVTGKGAYFSETI